MIEDFIASIPERYWTNPIRTVHSSDSGGFVNTVYLEHITIIAIPCCISMAALVGGGPHDEDCDAVKAVQSWEGRWF
ncbi:hypothetical protein LCGC14_2035380 [marine sediment metagenome]|uniref:Uncharacterized protein n=1 Tax=marine sediment metagenome TaxID=412755 RepID=A0A0F9ETD4_9ZZZZ